MDKGMKIAAAAAVLATTVALSGCAASKSQMDSVKKADANRCKGLSSCKGTSSCKGKNECKGK